MSCRELSLESLAALNLRVQGFLQDGYWIVLNYKANDLCVVRLRHHNGNIITLKLSADDGVIRQSGGRKTVEVY